MSAEPGPLVLQAHKGRRESHRNFQSTQHHWLTSAQAEGQLLAWRCLAHVLAPVVDTVLTPPPGDEGRVPSHGSGACRQPWASALFRARLAEAATLSQAPFAVQPPSLTGDSSEGPSRFQSPLGQRGQVETPSQLSLSPRSGLPPSLPPQVCPGQVAPLPFKATSQGCLGPSVSEGAVLSLCWSESHQESRKSGRHGDSTKSRPEWQRPAGGRLPPHGVAAERPQRAPGPAPWVPLLCQQSTHALSGLSRPASERPRCPVPRRQGHASSKPKACSSWGRTWDPNPGPADSSSCFLGPGPFGATWCHLPAQGAHELAHGFI